TWSPFRLVVIPAATVIAYGSGDCRMMPASSPFLPTEPGPTMARSLSMETFSVYVPGATSTVPPAFAWVTPSESVEYGCSAEPSAPSPGQLAETCTTSFAPEGAGGYASVTQSPGPLPPQETRS